MHILTWERRDSVELQEATNNCTVSTEIEYLGAVVATCETVWLKRLLEDLQVVSDTTKIYYDYLSNIQLAKNPVFHARTKHIEVHYHFVRRRVLSGDVELV